jgi:hypothetical protein
MAVMTTSRFLVRPGIAGCATTEVESGVPRQPALPPSVVPLLVIVLETAIHLASGMRSTDGLAWNPPVSTCARDGRWRATVQPDV